MNKVMVTGLAVGKDVGACEVCNFDLSWLMGNPSTLVWADKIILTPTMWSRIQDGITEESFYEYDECIKLLFQKAESENLVEIKDPAEIINKEANTFIFQQIEKDTALLAKTFPSVISVTPEVLQDDGLRRPEELHIGEYGYCQSYLFSIYASLLLSRIWGAQCLFNNNSFQFCKYRFGIAANTCHAQSKAFSNVFTTIVPNDDIFPKMISSSNEQCNSCGKLMECRQTCKGKFVTNLDKLLKWRDYDEISQIKSILDSIIKKVSKQRDIIDYNEIVSEYKSKEKSLYRKIRKVFPKVKRFANLTTLVSIPFAVLGLATNMPLLTITGASVAGISVASQQVIEYIKSRLSWVGFKPEKQISEE